MFSSRHIIDVYKAVCAKYGVISDENGVDAIARLNSERAERRVPVYDILMVEERFLYHDCAFLSAERAPENGGTPESNRANMDELGCLLARFRDRGMIEYFESEGWYQEEGSAQMTKENGYFCIDTWPNHATNFFVDMFALAERYHQDSFLFKSAGKGLTRTGYYVATNESALSKHKEGFWEAGELYYDKLFETNYTESARAFGERRVVFK